MKTFEITKEFDGRKVMRFLQKTLPSAGMGDIRKFLRLGRVKIDGKKAKEDSVLTIGQKVDIYVEDAFFEEVEKEDPFLSVPAVE